jgi:hypothetical protein
MEVVIGDSDGGERKGHTVPVGGENGVGEEKGGKERVFGARGDHAAGLGGGSWHQCRWRENLGAGGGRMGLGLGGNFWRGGWK